ncbi:MAG: DUF3306 domain-containing protein [Betaproteobacteria bacterium]|jgi:hypothetical protein|nr:DUF3306 domain-containing protein [Betaproteobacteria bacterium]
MAKDTEPFLSRWSRLKREGGDVEEAPAPGRVSTSPEPTSDARNTPDTTEPDAPLPDLPPIEELTPESDFRPFMDPRVPDALRRLALKKLYADPHFNVQDMLDDFAEDYTLLETLPAGMADRLAHARRTLLGHDEADRIEAEEQQAAASAAAEGAQPKEESVESPPPAEEPSQAAGDAPSRPSGEPRTQNG